MTFLLALTAVAAVAYLVGRRYPLPTAPDAPFSSPDAPVPPTHAERRPEQALADLDRRLSHLERTTVAGERHDRTADERGHAGRRDKPNALLHYEALASQVARERQLAELDGHGLRIERAGSGARVVRFPTRTVSAGRDRRDG